MDWNAHFKSLKDNVQSAAKTAVTAPPNPKWYDVRAWGMGEWGSVASFIGLGFVVNDLRKKKK